MIAIVSHCISFEELFDHEMTFQVVLNSRNECNTSCKEHQTTKTFKQWTKDFLMLHYLFLKLFLTLRNNRKFKKYLV